MVLVALLLEIADLALLLLRGSFDGGAGGLGLNSFEPLDVVGEGRLVGDEVGDERVHLVEGTVRGRGKDELGSREL